MLNFNHTALRMAKIHEVLAILSAIRLNSAEFEQIQNSLSFKNYKSFQYLLLQLSVFSRHLCKLWWHQTVLH